MYYYEVWYMSYEKNDNIIEQYGKVNEEILNNMKDIDSEMIDDDSDSKKDISENFNNNVI